MAGTIIPVGSLDTSGMEKSPEKYSIVITGWVLDARLDAKKVENAYATLVETWPILSARLRRSKTREWEYHLPAEFSSSRPRYIFKTVSIPGPIHERYAYPKPSDRIICTVKSNPNELYCQDAPHSADDLMKKDIPLVQLQLTLFEDASLIGLTTPHVLCDGHGIEEIINALSRILCDEKVVPLEPGDPFARFLDMSKPLENPPYWRVFSAWDIVVFLVCLLWDMAWNRNVQNREIFFPKEDVENIKEQAMRDLREEHGRQTDLWISSSDALVAFCLKCIYPPTQSRKPLNMAYPANLRRYLSDTIPRPYLHNATCGVIAPSLPLSAISTLSLGALAYHIRQGIHSQTARDAIVRWLSWRLANAGRMALFFEPSGAFNAVTNWRSMKLMKVDFSGALPDGIKDVKCVYLWGNFLYPFPVRNSMGIMADDPSGGIWVAGWFPEHVWERKDGFGRFTSE